MCPDEPHRFNWLFIDMDSFFASVEQHLRPELRGRILGITPVRSESSCVIAASAEAKRFGVRVGTRVPEARKLCPGIVFVKARPAVYVQVHRDIARSIDQCTPIERTYSIDEWAVRLRGEERRPEHAVALAERIKRKLRDDFSPWITCSIGVSSTRLLAKIASDLQKPGGLITLDLPDLPHRLEHLKLDDLTGISSGMLQRLHTAGISTIRQLWDLSRLDARRVWGSVQGEHWWAGFHGHDEPEQITHRHSFSHAHVLPPALRNDAGARGILIRLLCKGAIRLRHHKYIAHRLHVSVSSRDGALWHDQSPLPGTQDTLTITRQFDELWRARPWASRERSSSHRLSFLQVSMTLSELAPIATATGHLFPEQERLHRLSGVMDVLNQRWGNHTVYLGSLHDFRHTMEDKIAFGRIPDEALRM